MSDRRPLIRRRPLQAEPLPGHHPVVARVLAARGIDDPAQLDPALQRLLAPELADLDAACARLAQALRARERILVVGDFDADGATSTALALRALRSMGQAEIEYLVPNRFDFGYGLTPELVEVARERKPGLILTVDNGVSAHAGIEAAARHGIDTIVTDHHLPGPSLPAATAVVNPNRADCGFASKNLAGVGVVFYLLIALRARLEQDGYFAAAGHEPPNLAALLDLVALGTVADVVPLDRNNRILVEQGLRRIRAGHASPGVRALLEAAGRDPARACAGDLGYAIAPRLNAAGRLADMALGIETLLADDPDAARAAAARLDALNRSRREIESEMQTQAEQELQRLRERLPFDGELPPAITLHDGRWHQGVIGILAGRIREAVHRPTAILATAEDGTLKGSLRSIPGLHIRDVVAAVAARHPGLVSRFGGHAMAAGLTLPPDRLDAFRAAFAAEVERACGGCVPGREILTDGPLAAAELTLETAEALRRAGPWGAGFPEPQFDGEFEIRDHRTVGERHLKMSVATDGDAAPVDAIAFFADESLRSDPGRRARLVYRLDVNEFRGRRSAQLVVEHMEPLTDR
ncbi:MAG: single-stranded-DNA-specific exonuclease RecJ [Halofilum sp. (in: g-proteobacteria)]|nr:single-stranded-DNA-specific exonuclease RecJ [Halofilum sp. (in: g-proteobacteria)]